jgi:hypothetical protein
MAENASNYPPQPASSAIRVYDATTDRLVLDIPPGKHAGGLGCFALLWNAFMAVFTSFAGVAFFKEAQRPIEWLPIVLFGVFWLVGIGLIYGWLKLRFERCFLLVERDRAVLRKMFLGRQRQTELPLDESSRAQLIEAYRQNDVPVYRVTLSGVGGNALHFGTSLTQEEKDWCVDAINALLTPAEASLSEAKPIGPVVCEACGATIPADAFRSTAGRVICPACEHEQAAGPPDATVDEASLPDELPGIVAILEDSPDRLEFRLAMSESRVARGVVVLFAGGFAAVWYFIFAGAVMKQLHAVAAGGGLMDWFGALFHIPFLIAGFFPLAMALLALWGSITTLIDREQVVIRVHVGPFGKRWTMNTSDVTDVRLVDSSQFASRAGNPRVAANNPRARENHEFSKAAGICAGARVLAMTALHQPLTARFVVKRVRRWLHENVPGGRF